MLNVHCRDSAAVTRKIASMAQDGAAKLHIVADFDKTLTRAFVDGSPYVSTYAILREGKYLSPEYAEKSYALYDRYHPCEIAENIPLAVKKEKMNEWWQAHLELLARSGMNRDAIKDAARTGRIRLRDGTSEFFALLAKNRIPLLIFSAGLGDIIEEFLRLHNHLTTNVHIISNFYQFDEEGKFRSQESKFIHSLNKDEVAIKDTPYYTEVQERPNLVLLGDTVNDVGMATGMLHKEMLTIGFLNENQEKFLKIYKDTFDVVIAGDGPMEYVNMMIQKITEDQ